MVEDVGLGLMANDGCAAEGPIVFSCFSRLYILVLWDGALDGCAAEGLIGLA